MSGSPRKTPVKPYEQRFNLAEFGWPFMAESVDCAHQQPQPDFLGQRGERRGIKLPGPRSGRGAITEREVA
ncbi:MAG: hypothetical protein WCF68_02300, partial [Terriglobales bacterium]